MQGGEHGGELFPEVLVVPARLHLLEYEQTRRGTQHIRGVRPAEIVEVGQTDGFNREYVLIRPEQGLCK